MPPRRPHRFGLTLLVTLRFSTVAGAAPTATQCSKSESVWDLTGAADIPGILDRRVATDGNENTTVFAQAIQQRDVFEQDGFMVLRGALDMEAVEAARRYLDDVVWAPDQLQRPRLHLQLTRPGVYFDGDQNNSMILPEAPANIRRGTYRVECDEDPGVVSPRSSPTPWGRIVHDPGIRAVVDWLTNSDSEAVHTGPVPHHIRGCLFFERGTQQGLHKDTWYALGADHPGSMVGVWVALDDVDDDNGPVVYVPGSHLLPEVAMDPSASERRWRLVPKGYGEEDYRNLYKNLQHSVRELGLQEQRFYPKAGDVGIWHESLLHGGGPIRDMSRTRRSLVVHFARRTLDPKEIVFEAVGRIEKHYEDLDQAMHVADADHDGNLQLEEARALLRSTGMDLPDHMLDKLAMVLWDQVMK